MTQIRRHCLVATTAMCIVDHLLRLSWGHELLMAANFTDRKMASWDTQRHVLVSYNNAPQEIARDGHRLV